MRRHLSRWRCLWQCSLALLACQVSAQVVLTEGMTEEQTAKVSRLIEQTSRVRQLFPREPIHANIMARETLEAHLTDLILAEYPDDMLNGEMIMAQSLGLVPPGYDLLAGLTAMLSEQCAGLFDESSRRLYIMDWINFDSITAQVILAHEIHHAIQDQHFVLADSPIHDRNNTDEALAFMAVVEGDATLTMNWWAAEHAGPRFFLELPGLITMDQSALMAAPPAIQQQMLFPYMAGQKFCMWLITRPGGHQNINRALDQWPESTEQIIHPERSRFGDQYDPPTRITIDPIVWGVPEDWQRKRSDVLGELGVKFAMQNAIPHREAREIAFGWDGDRWEVWQSPTMDQTALLWDTVWDSDSDAEEFEDGLKRLLERQDLTATVTTSGEQVFATPITQILRHGTRVSFSLTDETGDVEITPPAE